MTATGKQSLAAKGRPPEKPAKRSFSGKCGIALLVLVPLAVYFRVVTLDYINIDDYHFIVTGKAYNQDLSNIYRSFERGLFQPADKTIYDYYRPLFLVDIILEYQLFGEKPLGYHLTNLVFHILSVILLYLFLKRIRVGDTPSLILALVFAVHPALSHAVAWISGRNDMMLMIFLLSAMIFTVDYGMKRSRHAFLLQALFFLLAVFTKETAVIIPLLGIMILAGVMKIPWKSIGPLGLSWLGVLLFWFFMESFVKQSGHRFPVGEMIGSGLGRIPALLQYFGKVILPVNLMVHPRIEDISPVWGILALAAIGAVVVLSKSYKNALTWTGAAWFLLFLIPVLAVPRTFSDLVYEHRLYVPLAGVLLILSPTFLLDGRKGDRVRLFFAGTLILVFGVMSFIRTGYYKGPLEYWSRAVAESPRDAYALQMMGTWVKDDAEQERIFRQAYALDPTLKDLNLNLGKLACKHGNPEEAEQFLKKELSLQAVKSPDNYFLLGRIAYERKRYGDVKKYLSEGLKIAGNGDAEVYSLLAKVYFMEQSYDSAALNLQKVIGLDPSDAPAHRNLVIIYMKQGKKENALAELREMQSRGLAVPPELLKLVGNH